MAGSCRRSASASPSSPAAPKSRPRKGSNNESPGPLQSTAGPMQTGLRGFVDGVAGPLMLLVPAPLLCLVLAFLTHGVELHGQRTVAGLIKFVQEHGVNGLISTAVRFCGHGDRQAWQFLGLFNLGALSLYWLPGKVKYGPATPTGHVPDYVDNGIAHCFLSTVMFIGGSNLGLQLWDLGIIYDTFPSVVGALNIFGLVFCAGLYLKGMHAPSGAGVAPDCGPSGYGPMFDYYWGAELYPRICNVDVKKFVNCRFSMSYWQLAGISFAYKSYTLHHKLDPGIVLCAVSQYLYLVKFFIWEIGYMRSIDIIVDRAGFYETWGCLVWVPSVYTLHTRLLVETPSDLSWEEAAFIFIIGLAGVGLNFWADKQRQTFRELDGKCLVWGKAPVYVKAAYSMTNAQTGKVVRKSSLLLASGWWGIARHLQYAFELTAAWSWGLLAGWPLSGNNGLAPLFYPIFLSILLIHRAIRDEEKCLAKYGSAYEEYMRLVPYKIVPFIY